MKKTLIVISVILGLGLMAFPGQATILLNEDFTSASIVVGSINDPTDLGPGPWYDFPNEPIRWTISTDTGNDYAQHLPQDSDQTNILFYGIDASGLAVGTTLSLDFIYQANNDRSLVYIAGLILDGTHDLDPFAPWFGGGDANDGIVLLNDSLGNTLSTSDWVPKNYEFTMNQAFDGLAVAFIMGGTGGFRAVDNVVIATPEPLTILILGFGLLGLFGLRRKE